MLSLIQEMQSSYQCVCLTIHPSLPYRYGIIRNLSPKTQSNWLPICMQ